MPDIQTVSLFATAAVSLMFTPGPAKLYLVGVSMGRGRVGGFLIALGIFTSDIIHVSLASFGVEVVFERYPNFFVALRYAGAAYLLYLAYHSLQRALSNRKLELADVDDDEPNARYYISGLLVNLFNPLAIVFYLSLLPQFVNPDSDLSRGTQMLAFGIAMVSGFLLFHFGIAAAAGTIEKRLTSNKGTAFAKYQGIVVAIVFSALALRLISQGN